MLSRRLKTLRQSLRVVLRVSFNVSKGPGGNLLNTPLGFDLVSWVIYFIDPRHCICMVINKDGGQ